MAVAQPPGAKAVEVLSYKDPAAGRDGPIAFQMHNQGLFDEVKERPHRDRSKVGRVDHQQVSGPRCAVLLLVLQRA